MADTSKPVTAEVVCIRAVNYSHYGSERKFYPMQIYMASEDSSDDTVWVWTNSMVAAGEGLWFQNKMNAKGKWNSMMVNNIGWFCDHFRIVRRIHGKKVGR